MDHLRCRSNCAWTSRQHHPLGHKTEHSHNAANQRTSTKLATGATTRWSYNTVGQRTGEATPKGQSTTFAYDSLSSVSDPLNHPTSYNSQGQLLNQSDTEGKTVSYGYDPQGRRIKKLVVEGTNKTETHYVLDTERAYHEIVIERTRKNNDPWQQRTYLHTTDEEFGGVGELISDSDGATTRQVYTDGQGSTRLVKDGGTSLTYNYEAFGNLLTGSTEKVTHGYTGERFDPDTGLIYLRARDYDPSTGRFISMDEHPGAKRIPLTLNKYLYTNADPVNHIDPSGHMILGAIVDIGFSLNLQGATRVGSAQGARIVLRQLLFGKPPDSLGIIGEVILNSMINGLADVAMSGLDFPNKGAAGTQAHQNLKKYVIELAKDIEGMSFGDIQIRAESFSDDNGEHYGKGRKGSVGIDVLIKHQGKNVLSMDLKIGKGTLKVR